MAKVYYGTPYYKGVDERQMGYEEANMSLAMAEITYHKLNTEKSALTSSVHWIECWSSD